MAQVRDELSATSNNYIPPVSGPKGVHKEYTVSVGSSEPNITVTLPSGQIAVGIGNCAT